MKCLSAFLMLLVINAGHAQETSTVEVYGGVLETHNGDVLSAACQTQDSATKKCQSFRLYSHQKGSQVNDSDLVGSFTATDIKALSVESFKFSHHNFEQRMSNAYILPAGLTIIMCSIGVQSACPLVVPAIAFDIVKAPFVLAAHGILEIKEAATRGRFKSGLKFLVNPKKKGEIKKIKERDLLGLAEAF